MNLNFNLPQTNAPFGYGFGGFGAPGMGGPNGFGGQGMGGPNITIQLGNVDQHRKCCSKKKSKRSGGLLGGIKDFLRNIGEAFLGEKSDKKCKKGCRDRHHQRPCFGGPMASANVKSMNISFGF